MTLLLRLWIIAAFSVLATVSMSQPALANTAHDTLQSASSGERNVLFAKFLRGSGEKCDVVTRNFYQGMTNTGDVFWNVACGNGRAYSIMINNDSDGSTKIVNCAVLKAMNGTPCFKKL